MYGSYGRSFMNDHISLSELNGRLARLQKYHEEAPEDQTWIVAIKRLEDAIAVVKRDIEKRREG
jgi:hypothetical protein